MIFVAVGTTDFDDLIRAMEALSLSLGVEVIMQIGRSRYVPQHTQHFRFAPSLTPFYERAALVVSHGGLGIVTEVMELGRPLVAVEDPNQPDRHQREILTMWEREGHLVWCREVAALPHVIEQARAQTFQPYRVPPSRIHTLITEFVNGLAA